jgi:hypothetical protein
MRTGVIPIPVSIGELNYCGVQGSLGETIILQSAIHSPDAAATIGESTIDNGRLVGLQGSDWQRGRIEAI